MSDVGKSGCFCPTCGQVRPQIRDAAVLAIEALGRVPRQERQLALHLARHLSHWCSNERIVEVLYGDQHDGGPERASENVWVLTSRLRKRMSGSRLRIETSRYMGYRLVFDGTRRAATRARVAV